MFIFFPQKLQHIFCLTLASLLLSYFLPSFVRVHCFMSSSFFKTPFSSVFAHSRDYQSLSGSPHVPVKEFLLTLLVKNETLVDTKLQTLPSWWRKPWYRVPIYKDSYGSRVPIPSISSCVVVTDVLILLRAGVPPEGKINARAPARVPSRLINEEGAFKSQSSPWSSQVIRNCYFSFPL